MGYRDVLEYWNSKHDVVAPLSFLREPFLLIQLTCRRIP